jgi:hypothetical protein
MTAGSNATARPNDAIWQQRSARGPIRAIRRILLRFAVVSLLGIAQTALATSFSTDQSDLWYVPTESGWGMQLVQRDSIIFATLFVYDMNNKPTWYVATLTYQGNLVWNGDLLATTGPWFGAIPFDASTVVVRKVGTMSWTAQAATRGTTSYSVDGVNVSKSIVRQSLAVEDYSGHYAGATHLATTGCVDPTRDVVGEDIAVFYVTQIAQTVTLTSFPIKGGSCSYAGVLTQSGQMGAFAGSYVCSSGEEGSFAISEMQVSLYGFGGRMTSQSPDRPSCQSSGWIGAARVTAY